MYSKSKKKRNPPIYFNTNYRTEMKLVPIIMDYCLLHFYALKFFLRVCLHGRSLLNLNFFKWNSPPPRTFQRNRNDHLSNCLDANFHNASEFLRARELLAVGNIANARFKEECFFQLNISGVNEINWRKYKFHPHY